MPICSWIVLPVGLLHPGFSIGNQKREPSLGIPSHWIIYLRCSYILARSSMSIVHDFWLGRTTMNSIIFRYLPERLSVGAEIPRQDLLKTPTLKILANARHLFILGLCWVSSTHQAFSVRVQNAVQRPELCIIWAPRPRIRAPFRAARLKIFDIERCCTSSGQTRGCYSLVAGAAVASNNGFRCGSRWILLPHLQHEHHLT